MAGQRQQQLRCSSECTCHRPPTNGHQVSAYSCRTGMHGANSTGQVYCFAAAVARRGTQYGRSGRDDIDWYRGAVGVQDGIEDGFLRHFEGVYVIFHG